MSRRERERERGGRRASESEQTFGPSSVIRSSWEAFVATVRAPWFCSEKVNLGLSSLAFNQKESNLIFLCMSNKDNYKTYLF